MKTLWVPDRPVWRSWLEEHHDSEPEIWLTFYKQKAGLSNIPYEEAVEEALCFGWIDSLIKKLDEKTYARKFTPRKMASKWSELNKKRVAKMISEGRMTAAGLAKITYDLNAALRAKTEPHELTLPEELVEVLRSSTLAWENYGKLSSSQRRLYVRWILDAKQDATRHRRLREAVEKLERNEKIGLK